MRVRVLSPWVERRLQCGLGHRVSGLLRRVQHEGHSIDGDAFWYPPSNDYDPKRCVVCGLVIWNVAEECAQPPDIGADVPGGGAV